MLCHRAEIKKSQENFELDSARLVAGLQSKHTVAIQQVWKRENATFRSIDSIQYCIDTHGLGFNPILHRHTKAGIHWSARKMSDHGFDPTLRRHLRGSWDMQQTHSNSLKYTLQELDKTNIIL